jgi:hypothetical protein
VNPWRVSFRADPDARVIADRHYNRQAVGSAQFVPPGRCVVLVIPGGALWVTSWPFAEYVKHAWAGAWVCSAFRNERPDTYRSSDLIRAAVAATRAVWDPPPLGMITFVDESKTRRKRDPGRCYRRAGFHDAIDPNKDPVVEMVTAGRRTRTKGGLIALQLLPGQMPDADPAQKNQGDLFAEAS